ncbi:aldose epimerase family protein [Noviherbaspirillum aerium]|uniref:aldose epimerase family protein n=1 Tax=Noviherbaspirillum aerium TaxID=2588497 RepID=UPI00178C786F|nr:hypothetical protein [Noviherbaspirillum aerium]
MSGNSIVLGTHVLEAEILPAQGGRIGCFRVLEDGDATEIFTPYAMQPQGGPAYGAFPMIPYSHRIRQGAFAFAGHRYTLPADSTNHPHVMHGVCRDIPWQVVALSKGSLHLRTHYEGHRWPWRIRADQYVELMANRLTVTLSLTNLGTLPMPAGLGFHPYFSATEARYVAFSADVQ